MESPVFPASLAERGGTCARLFYDGMNTLGGSCHRIQFAESGPSPPSMALSLNGFKILALGALLSGRSRALLVSFHRAVYLQVFTMLLRRALGAARLVKVTCSLTGDLALSLLRRMTLPSFPLSDRLCLSSQGHRNFRGHLCDGEASVPVPRAGGAGQDRENFRRAHPGLHPPAEAPDRGRD